jgi:UDP-glucose 4-epimerase
MKKKILIIGSGGNIGQYIYNNLDKNKYLIFGIEKENNLKKNIFNFKKILKKNISFDTIIHAAGVNPTKFSKKKNIQIYNENKIINDNCLKIINKKKSNKVIFLSSFSVYKKNKYINEASNLENNNLYAKSKIEFEQQLLNLKNSVYILRLCSVVGLGTKNNWLTEIYNTVQNNKKVILFNKNNNFNNCFDIEDLNLVINKIIKKKTKLKKIYNCASNNNIKIKYIKKILDKNKKFTNKVSFKLNKDLEEFYNDSSKIQKDLKIKFKNTKEIIEKYFSLNVKKKIFIIGSKGYIGSNLSKNLKKKFEIHNIDQLEDIKFKRIDKNSTIIFCALKSNTKNFLKLNISILKDYLNILKDKNFEKFIYLSTLHSNNLSYKNMHTIRENLLKEHLKGKYIILCPGKVYGKRIIHSNYGINSMMYDYKKNKILKIFGDGNNYCPHIHISDLEKFFIKILETSKKKFLNKRFSIYDSRQITFYQIANIFKKYDKKVSIIKSGKELKYKINNKNQQGLIKFNCKFLIDSYIKNFIKKNVI